MWNRWAFSKASRLRGVSMNDSWHILQEWKILNVFWYAQLIIHNHMAFKNNLCYPGWPFTMFFLCQPLCCNYRYEWILQYFWQHNVHYSNGASEIDISVFRHAVRQSYLTLLPLRDEGVILMIHFSNSLNTIVSGECHKTSSVRNHHSFRYWLCAASKPLPYQYSPGSISPYGLAGLKWVYCVKENNCGIYFQ